MSERVRSTGNPNAVPAVPPGVGRQGPNDNETLDEAAEEFSSLLAGPKNEALTSGHSTELSESRPNSQVTEGADSSSDRDSAVDQRSTAEQETNNQPTSAPPTSTQSATTPVDSASKLDLQDKSTSPPETSSSHTGLDSAPASDFGKTVAGQTVQSPDGKFHDHPNSVVDKEQSDRNVEGLHADRQPESQQHSSPGDAILQNLSQQVTSEFETTAVVSQNAGPETSTAINRVAQAVASQVLVSNPSTGEREVRIVLKDSVLPGTEVRIADHAGKLQIQFVTSSTDSQDTLTQNQMALQQTLNEKLSGRDVIVSVDLETHEQGSQQDGHSRQRRHVEEEWQPDDTSEH